MKIKKFLVNILCAFIPSQIFRHKLREQLIKNTFINKGANNRVILIQDGKEHIVNSTKIAGLDIKIIGNNNTIVLTQDSKKHMVNSAKIAGLDIKITGNNNTIRLHISIKANHSAIGINNDNACIEIGFTYSFDNIYILCPHGNGQVCKIGNGFSCWGMQINLTDSSQCIIGEDCMFSGNIMLRASDNHIVLDRDTKKILNKSAHPLTIGNHCWIGYGVSMTKNASIPNNTIIGIGSVVSKTFTEEFTAIAGNPARVIKRNVVWGRESIPV